MRRQDAPPAGWYPDPQNRSRLRWWDGLDWTDIRRPVPSEAELLSFEQLREREQEMAGGVRLTPPSELAPKQVSRAESQEIITQVRNAARSEIDRAAELFSQRASAATREIEPLISKYSSQVTRWVRWALIIATIVLIAWVLFQVFAQASLFEWIGDRIDNLTEENGAAVDMSEEFRKVTGRHSGP